jgi:glycine oxidase
MSDFLIVGGGVIGMMLARELALGDAKVTLAEAQQCGRESSWAGGGIVSPLYPWRYTPAVTQLSTWSQSSYIELADALKSDTGIDPELRQKGMYMVEVDDEADALDWAKAFQRPLVKVDGDHLYRNEPSLVKGIESALWMPEVASIRNPRLGQSLRAWLHNHPNIQLHEHTRVEKLALNNEAVTGVISATGETLSADHTVICAGAWSGGLLDALSLQLPVEPVKGQMMVFNTQPGLVNRVVLKAGRYVIPRNDGRVLVGSTLERVGFDKEATGAAYASLYETALSIVPSLAKYPVEHHWAGLRPGSPEGVPFIGEVPGFKGLSVNAGQFRNGLVLAPASTRLHADLLLGRAPVIDPTPYQLVGRI